MRKILYVHGNSDIIGGVENFIETCLFYHKKFEPYIIFINDGRLPQRIKEKGFQNVYTLKGRRLRHLHKTIISIYKIAKFVKDKKIDVIMGEGFHAWIYAGLASKLAKIKSTQYVQGILCKEELRFFHLIDWLATHIKPDIFIANSYATQESVKKIFKNNIPIEVIHLAVDTSIFEKEMDTTELRQELKIPKDSCVVSMTARIQEWKGQEYFIRAAKEVLKEIPNVYFLVVGTPTFDKDKIYYKRLIKLVEEFDIEKRVIFTGFRENIPEILKLSSIIVATSIKPEPFGLSILEAMASGKPVIATEVGGPLEIIDNGIDGVLVASKNEFALKETIIKLLRDENLRNNVGERARLKVKEKFSIENCIFKIENTLEKII